MSVECDAVSLAEAAHCFNQGYGPLVLKAMRIRLLCAVLNNESMTCTPAALSELVSCFLSTDEGTLDAIETYLVCQIANSGGGGNPCVTCSETVPVTAPDDSACDCAIVFGIGAIVGNVYVWDTAGAPPAWFPVIGGP